MGSLKKSIGQIINSQLSPLNLRLLKLSHYDRLVSDNERLTNKNAQLVRENTRLVSENANASHKLWTWLRQTYSIETIIDIGANNGEFAEFLASYFNAKETYVFEPLNLYLFTLRLFIES